MKKIAVAAALIGVLVYAAPVPARIRCGNTLISEGDSVFEVSFRMKQCEGEVLGQQVVGLRTAGKVDMSTTYDNRDRTAYSEGTIRTKSATEESWYVRLKEGPYRYCYRLFFFRGRLDKIEGWERCD